MQVIKMKRQETVYPSRPSPGGTVELSNNDQIIARVYTSLLLFFPELPAAQEACSSALILKSSLADTLSLFYPLAGRYREKPNGELQIECTDEGSALHEAWVDRGFDCFLPNFDPHPDFQLLVPPFDISTDISQVPLMQAQITHFECGRICLGVSLHHNACDGFSIDQFLSCWATMARGKLESKSQVAAAAAADCNMMIKKPYLDRSLLKARNPPAPTSEHPEFLVTKTPFNLLAAWAPCTGRVFPFTPSAIDKLRERAENSESAGAYYTRFEALSAYLWRGITYARGLNPSQQVRLGMTVDGRQRFDPPLPEGFFGNVVYYGLAVCRAGELVDRPFSYGAELVKTAIAKVDDRHMRSALDWVALQESPKSVVPAFSAPSIDLGISSWSRFSFYELDFGWGKPSHVRLPYAVDGGIFLLPSPLGPGHIDAFVGLHSHHMPRFEEYLCSLF